LILGLKPQEAQILIAAQQKFKLTLALRRPGDETAINRLDVGMVDSESFNKLLNGMESVTLSAKPGMAVGVEKK
jgi:Flp pilus assembly protein CpaB